MANNAKIDENGRPSIIGASNLNGTTIIQVQASTTSHALSVNNGYIGIDSGNNNGNAMLDENSKAVWVALSASANGSFVEVYTNSSNQVLIQST